MVSDKIWSLRTKYFHLRENAKQKKKKQKKKKNKKKKKKNVFPRDVERTVAKIQISLRITVWSESSPDAFWIEKDAKFILLLAVKSVYIWWK